MKVSIGQYREPPSNKKMIRYFHQHEAEFEQWVTDYAIVKYSYNNCHTTLFLDRGDILRFQMAELGIRQVSAGAYLIEFNS